MPIISMDRSCWCLTKLFNLHKVKTYSANQHNRTKSNKKNLEKQIKAQKLSGYDQSFFYEPYFPEKP